MILFASLIVAGAVWWAAQQIVDELKASRDEALRGRALMLLDVLAPALAAAEADPRGVLAWQPIARTARALFPDESAALDRAAGGAFPFSRERLQAAHDRWTAEWLGWERSHDAEYKVKAAEAEQALAAAGGSPIARARLETVEREKLDLYQRRYQEYVRIAKALQGLIG